MLKQFHIFISALLMLCSASVSAQRFTVTTVPSMSKMPVTAVNCILQDREGYMWYGSNQAGLCRDDGYQIMAFGDNVAPDILCNDDVLCIADDGQQRIWFGTREGLYILDKHNYSISVACEELHHQRISDFKQDKDGTMWVVHSSYITHVALDGTVIETFKSHYKDELKTVRKICVARNGDVWAAQWKGNLLRKTPQSKDFKKVDELTGLSPNTIVEDTLNNCFYVGTWGNGIYRMTVKGRNITVTPTSETAEMFQHLTLDYKHNKLWGTTYNHGLLQYGIQNGNLVRQHSLYDDMLAESILTSNLAFDQFGNLWVPNIYTEPFVISHTSKYIDSRHLFSSFKYTSTPSVVSSVLDNGDEGWLTIENGGIGYYDFKNDALHRYEGSSDTTEIAKGPDRSIFVWNNDRSVSLVSQTESGFSTRFLAYTYFNMCKMWYDDKTKLLYAGGKNGSLVSISLDGKMKTYSDSLVWVYNIVPAPDNKSIYFLSYNKGICRMDKASGQITSLAPNDRKLSDIAVAPDGTVWASSFLGKVYTLSGSELQEVPLLTTRGGDAILHCLFDAKGHLWLLSNKYVCEYNPATSLPHTIWANDNQIQMRSFENISLARNGVIIGGTSGVVRILSSSHLDKVRDDVTISVSQYTYGGKTMPVYFGQREITVSADSSSQVILSLTTFDYLKASNVEYYYKVEGYNKEWVLINRGANDIQIQNLPKGEYNVLVRSTDGFGHWTAPQQIFLIDRLPAWWESWWAYTLYIIIIAAIFYGIHVFRKEMTNRRLRFEHLLGQYNDLMRHSADVKAANEALEAEKQEAVRRHEQQVREEEERRIAEAEKIAMAVENEEVPTVNDTPEEEEPSSHELSLYDKNLLEKAIRLIEKNMSNCDYSVDDFASDMCMSRMTLYRKIYALTGQTPSDLMRTYRLNKAVEYLQTTSLSLNDIADKVGFSTARYFSSCFKKRYGVLPKNYK